MAGEAPDVTCADVRAAIRSGTLTAEIRAHGADCPACAVLLADDGALGRRMPDPTVSPATDAITDQVLARIRRERNPVPRFPSWLRSAAVWGVVFLPAVVIALARPRPDLASYPVERMIGVLAAWLLAGAVAGLVVLRPIHRPMVAARGVWVAVALLGPILVGLLPRIENGLPEPPWLDATIHCFSRGSAAACLVLVGLWVSDRRSTAGPFWWAGACGLAAVAGGLALQLSCSVTDVRHLVVAHGSIGLVLGAVTAGVAGVLVRGRKRRT